MADRIDLHVHVFPEKMFKAVWDYFEFFGWNVHHQLAGQIAATLMSHGITQAVALSYPHKKGIAGSLNRFMASLASDHPIFIPFASVYPDDDDFREIVDFSLTSPHIFGFKFQPLVQQFDINDPRLDYLYENCMERDMPLIIHIGSGPMNHEFVGFDYFKKLMRRFETLRVCVPHMGLTEYNEFLYMLDDHPKMFLDTTMINTRTDFFDTIYHGDTETLMKHADRICFGSDWPIVPYHYQEAIDSVSRFGFTEEQLNHVFYENALTFLNLKTS
ncbi:MAG: amidohydrolase [Proteobacteria bacterium]|nr:amidohydrolase [Pseudomonadota bacterium]